MIISAGTGMVDFAEQRERMVADQIAARGVPETYPFGA